MTIAAMLEEGGYRRDEIKNLTRWYVLRVLQHLRDDKGNLIAIKRGRVDGEKVKRIPYETICLNILRKRNYPEHLIPWKIQQMVEAERIQAEKRQRRNGANKKQKPQPKPQKAKEKKQPEKKEKPPSSRRKRS